MSLYRHSEPFTLQLVWKAIEVIRGQRQLANISRITKIIQRDHPYTSKEILHHILRAVRDNMVVETLSLGCKGSKAGMEQVGYWIPEDADIMTGETTHDMYCFSCHKPGELIRCLMKGCVRAYHMECIEGAYRPTNGMSRGKAATAFSCRYCVMRSRSGSLASERKVILNKCLGFIARRALETAPDLATHPSREEHMHYSYFIKEHQDLKKLVESCSRAEFATATDFLLKVELIEHNCVLLQGQHSELAVAAKKMLETCTLELNELELCLNCYYLSSTKPSKDWFCVPCEPPHKVIWAKQKGFEYWPAKVIQGNENKLDVRFFGGHHERAWVTLNCTKSISVGPSELQIKITKGWKKACEEMKKYITQTERALGAETATSMMKFDFKTQKDARTKQNAKGELGERAKKRRAEIRDLIARKKKPKFANGESPIGQEKSSTSANNSTTADEPLLAPSIVEKRILESEKRVKRFGQRAKLDEECARSWCYGTECILMYRNEDKLPKVTPGKSTHRKPQYMHKRVKCNCYKRYTRKLLNYKASVRKLVMRERNDNLITSSFYIRQFLIKHSSHVQALEDEVSRLREENAKLKAVFNGPDAAMEQD